MGIINREYLAEGFSVNDKKIKDLSLLMSNDGFSFAIFDVDSNLLGLRSYRLTVATKGAENRQQECLETIGKDPLLKSIFRNVKIALDESQFSLVPDKLFDERYPEKYLEVEHELVEDKLIWVDKVSTLEGRNIHYLQKTFQEQLSAYFSGAVFRHRTTSLIELFAKTIADDANDHLFAHVDERKVFVFFFKNGKLQHTNEFEFHSPNDFLYFILLNYKECGLNPEETALNLSGLLDNKSMVYDKLYRYIKKLQWTSGSMAIALGAYLEFYPLHYDLELFALQLCE